MAFVSEIDAGRWAWRGDLEADRTNDGHSRVALSLAAKVSILVWFACIAVVWGIVRSSANAGGHEVAVFVRLAFMIAILLPSWLVVSSRLALYWLLGASATVGMLPEVPLMPYVREGTHLVIAILAMHVAVARARNVIDGFRSSVLVKLLASFCALALLSTSVNYYFHQSIWQLKVGIAELILLSCFTVVLADVSSSACEEEVLPTIIDGFALSAFFQLAISPFVMFLTLTMPVTEGNDTIFGLGYWDRLKSTFAGPDQAGAFFLAAIPLVIWWLLKERSSIWRLTAVMYLQVAPWLIIASGSRTSRVATLIVVASLLVRRTSRTLAIWMLPSMTLAFAIGFYFQSLPSAVEALKVDVAKVMALTGVTEGSNSFEAVSASLPTLKGRFFEDPARIQLVKDCISDFVGASFIVKVIGSGFGVAGFREGGFSSAHVSLFDALAELGVAGALLLSAFALLATFKLARHVFFVKTSCKKDEIPFYLMTVLIVVLLTSLTYDVKTWSTTLVLITALASAVSHRTVKPLQEASVDRTSASPP